MDDRQRRWTWSWAAAGGVGLVGAAVAAYARYVQPLRPGVTLREGFYAWWDQSQYLLTAEVLASGRLPAGPHEFQFGVGYPAAGAVFSILGFEGDPFAPVDVIGYGVTAVLTFVLARRLVTSSHSDVAGLLAVVVFVVGTPSLQLASVPWNTNLVTPLVVLVLVGATSSRPLGWLWAATIGVALGWVFATRYADALFLGLPVLAVVARAGRREAVRVVVGAGVAAAIVIGGVLVVHNHAFGDPLTTPYRFHLREDGANDQSLGNYDVTDIPAHFWGTVVSGRAGGLRVNADPLLRQAPLLPLAGVGAVVAWQRRRERTRPAVTAAAVTAAVASVLASAFYLSFVAGGPDDLVFSNVRYFAVWFPVWSVLISVALVAIVRWVQPRRATIEPPSQVMTSPTV